MSQISELKKIEDYIENLFKSKKNPEEIKQKLRQKGLPDFMIERLIQIVDSEIINDNTDQYKITGKNLDQIKIFLLEDGSLLLRRKNSIFSKSYDLSNGELFIYVINYGFTRPQSITILCEFKDNECLFTVVPDFFEPAFFRPSEKIKRLLEKMVKKNNWKIEQLESKKNPLFSD